MTGSAARPNPPTVVWPVCATVSTRSAEASAWTAPAAAEPGSAPSWRGTGRDVRPPGSADGARVLLGEEHQGGLDAAADVRAFGEAQLPEDRVDVLLDRALGQEQHVG